MSHFLRGSETRGKRSFGKARAAVKAQIKSGGLWIEGGVTIALPDAKFVELPARVPVVGLGGAVILQSGGHRFFVSTETIDPYHLVIEVEEREAGR